MATPNLELPEIARADSDAADDLNEGWWALDCIVQLSVVSATTATPPADVQQGDRYIVPTGSPTATGAWAGRERHVAYYSPDGWRFQIPRAGWLAYVQDQDAELRYDGTAWASQEVQSLPAGGAAGEVLVKFSAADGDAVWSGYAVPAGGTLGQVLTKQSGDDGDAAWETPTGAGSPTGTSGGGFPPSAGEVVYFVEDFIYEPNTSGILWDVTWTGTGANATGAAEAGHPGCIDLITGTQSTGSSRLIYDLANGAPGAIGAGVIIGGGCQITMDWLVKYVGGIPGTSNTVSCLTGLANATQGSTAFIVFEAYLDGSTYKWAGRTYNGSTAQRVIGSAFSADTWYHLRAVIASDGGSVEFFVGGVSIGTITGNLPTAQMGPVSMHYKTAGTTSLTLRIDVCSFLYEFITPRW